ncbi:MAG: hypothetical protein ACR2Q3_04945 [Woeseiaceae bacterium]
MSKQVKSAALAILLCLGGCAAPEVLESRSGAVPEGVDLSGNWRIRTDSSASQRRVREAVRKTDGIKDDEYFRDANRQQSGARGGSQSRRSNSKGGLVHVFLELGRSLKVTQTVDGLFISFDRSVVEEFRFGENRVVSVGEVQAQRVTGWDNDTLIVETLDRNSMKLTDRFRLLEGGTLLERSIEFRSKSKERESVTQLFDKVN